MSSKHENFVGGEWVASADGEAFDVQNPANTTETVSRYQRSTAADADEAVVAAADAQPGWAATPGPERGAVLRRTGELLADRKESLTTLLTREEGKTPAEAEPEVQRAIDIFHYYGEKAREFDGTVKPASGQNKNLRTRKEPMGVAALVTPWNYPIAIPAWKIAPALATGNAVVLKPASEAPSPAREIIECLDEAGLPSGVANFITGSGSIVGETLVTHDAVDVVSFTGSTQVGTTVYEQSVADGKRAQCEMGGKNATVVLPSTDIEEAVETVGAGAFGVTGQACTATSRAIVHEDVYDEFVEGIVAHAEDIEVGSGLDGADMGPQANDGELSGTLEYIEIADEDGATLETGGSRLDEGDHANGYYVQPTVFSGVSSEMRIAQEEVFGPVLAVIPASDFEEAVEVANDSDYGLSASVLTNDLSEAERFARDVESGVVKVNEKTTGLELHVPFGGVKQSSTNTYREQGDAGLEFFTTTKTIYTNF
jgi:2,5-dioxopentanoate dehydrogenase